MERLRVVGAVAITLATCGCFTPQGSLRSRLAREFGCPEGSINVQEIGNRTYRVDNCGPVSTYICDGGGDFQAWTCIRESITQGGEMTGPGNIRPPTTGQPSVAEIQLRAAIDQRRDAIFTCVPGAQNLVVRGEFQPNGVVLFAVGPPYTGTAEEACIQAALNGTIVHAAGPGIVLHPLTRPPPPPPEPPPPAGPDYEGY